VLDEKREREARSFVINVKIYSKLKEKDLNIYE